MKSPVNQLITLLFFCTPLFVWSQILMSNGGTISISAGGILYCNGGISLANSSSLTNNGELTTTKNSVLPLKGTISILSSSNVNGSGEYYIEQDWVNDAFFSSNASSVYLYGNTEQVISSTNGTITEFNNLILSGTGSGIDKRKTLQGVDAKVSTTGTLSLSNRELYTQSNSMYILNPASTAVHNDLVLGEEGYVSSIDPGYLIWNTNSSSTYYFPLGSSIGTPRYRPISISPLSNSNNTYSARLDNQIGDDYGFYIAQHSVDLELLNPLFFHSIEQLTAGSSADLSIAYSSSDDGSWTDIGEWDSGENQWSSIKATGSTTLGNYNAVYKNAWAFIAPDYSYVLATNNEELVIPNVFTPNGDGDNDSYFVEGKGITEFKMHIVNRWGNIVFETDDINEAWDGKVNGNTCADGVYFYRIDAKSITKEYKEHGHITLFTTK